MDKASDCTTYHLIPLFKPEEAELRLFCIHPAGRYAMNLAPLANGFTQQVRMNYLSTRQLRPFCQMVKKGWISSPPNMELSSCTHKEFGTVLITAGVYHSTHTEVETDCAKSRNCKCPCGTLKFHYPKSTHLTKTCLYLKSDGSSRQQIIVSQILQRPKNLGP